MNESLRADSNYPHMSDSEWKDAPFNQSEPDEVEFNPTIFHIIELHPSIFSSEYVPVADDDGVSNDYQGNYVEDFKNQYMNLRDALHIVLPLVQNELWRIMGLYMENGRFKHGTDKLVRKKYNDLVDAFTTLTLYRGEVKKVKDKDTGIESEILVDKALDDYEYD